MAKDKQFCAALRYDLTTTEFAPALNLTEL